MTSTYSVNKGFSLIELMIAVAIVAIIAVIAVPAYKSQSLKARRSDGQAFLLAIQSRMERYMFDNDAYPLTLDLMNGYSNSIETSPEGFYEVQIKAPDGACPITSCYVLEAIALGAQVDDGNLELYSNGLKTGNWN